MTTVYKGDMIELELTPIRKDLDLVNYISQTGKAEIELG